MYPIYIYRLYIIYVIYNIIYRLYIIYNLYIYIYIGYILYICSIWYAIPRFTALQVSSRCEAISNLSLNVIEKYRGSRVQRDGKLPSWGLPAFSWPTQRKILCLPMCWLESKHLHQDSTTTYPLLWSFFPFHEKLWQDNAVFHMSKNKCWVNNIAYPKMIFPQFCMFY